MKHLREKLIDSEYLPADASFSLEDLKQMLNARFDSIDYAQAKEDVTPFIRDVSSLDIWSADFFKQITIGLTELA